MRPTTKDLAEKAGVSLATVDRVLNDRPNVSNRARQRVEKAIADIGYVRNLAAVNLAKNRTYQFRFLFPHTGDQYLHELISSVSAAGIDLKADLTETERVQLNMRNPHDVANYLSDLDRTEVDGIAIMAPESPQVRDAIARLGERGIKVVQFLSGQEKSENLDFVGVDNVAAGATAGRIISRFLGPASGKVMVVTDTMQSLNNIQRRLGFDQVMETYFPRLTSLPSLETHGDDDRTQRIIARQLQNDNDIIAVYVISSEARIPVLQIAKNKDLSALTIVVHERTPFTEQALINEDIDAVVAQNPGHAVRSALRILRARCDNRQIVAAQEKIRIEVLLKDNL
ncbi:MAG: LacI family DNA-binding transcriptional regulator [Acidiferrobacterales bacterium]|nr:LacI family DNA-binding transcriptional regulator [Acidiferrobacterales bacterium]